MVKLISRCGVGKYNLQTTVQNTTLFLSGSNRFASFIIFQAEQNLVFNNCAKKDNGAYFHTESTGVEQT